MLPRCESTLRKSPSFTGHSSLAFGRKWVFTVACAVALSHTQRMSRNLISDDQQDDDDNDNGHDDNDNVNDGEDDDDDSDNW